MKNKKKLRFSEGITLIALVVTIIILLILAGVTINLVLGENGILSKTKKAKEEQVISAEKEQISIAYSACQTELANADEKIVTADAMQVELIKNKNDTTTDSEDEDGYLLYVTFNNTNHDYTVTEEGKIEYIPKENADTSEIDKKLVTQNINYQDSLNTLMNPDRGFYMPAVVTLNPLGFTSTNMQYVCNNAKRNNIKLVHLRINIGELSGNKNADGIDKEFTKQQLNALNDLLQTIRENNMNAIIRFSYDTDGKIGNEPKSFDTIKRHIQQLSSVFKENKDIISNIETGFLGPWGEMHDAGEYQSDNYYKEVIETLLKNTPNEISINVRTPHYYKIVAGELNQAQQRIGIFNDGYLGSSTDLGTFNNEITRDDFINWMQTHGKYTLYGGEATKSSDASEDDEKYSESSFAIEEMPKTHTAYLNSEFNRTILDDKWTKQTYINANSEYNGQTAYKYIADHLGYRIVLRNSQISSDVQKGDICGVNLNLENVGFGNIVKKQKVSVILKKGTTYYEAKLDVKSRNINSGTNEIKFYFYIPSDIEDGDWEVYLKFCDKNNSNYSIEFANSDIWDSKILANKIGKVTIKGTAVAEGINIKQAFSRTAKDGTKEIIDTSEHRTIPVTLNFYNTLDSKLIGSISKNIIYGTTINFKDKNSLSELGISFPEGYNFKFAQCYDIANDWNGYDSIAIPAEPDKGQYIIQVYVSKEEISNKIPVTFGFYSDGNMLNFNTVDLQYGTTIDFKDATSLSNLGITIPDGYTFDYAQCYAITGNWDAYNSITIPKETTEKTFWINVFLNKKN